MKRFVHLLVALVITLTPLIYQGAPSDTVAAGSYCVDSRSQAFLTLINNYRTANGVAPLTISPTLGEAAVFHNDELTVNNLDLSHTGQNGSTPVERAQDAGYPSGYVGENILYNYDGSAQAAFNQWKASPGHNANMLRGSYGAIGIAWAKNSSSGRYYWTTNFGDVVDATASSCETPPPPLPTGTRNPSFNGSTATVITSTSTMNSNMTIKTRDGDFASNWNSATKPGNGQVVIVTLDLGVERNVSGVKWATAFNGYADKFTVRLMNSNYESTTLGTFTNPGSSRTWYGTSVGPTVKARWVKFYFENPNNDRVVGSISEIQVYATDTSNNPPPPGISRPGFAGSELSIDSVRATSNSGAAHLMADGSLASNWASAQNPGGTTTITVDLGSEQQITGVKWMTAYLGYLDEFSVSLMDSNYRSYSLGTFGNPTSSRTYFGTEVDGPITARWVKFYIHNPNGDGRVGSISDISIYGTSLGGQSIEGAPGLIDPVFGGELLQIVESNASSNDWQTSKTYDGNPESNWASQPTTPEQTTITWDLGADVPVTGVKWQTTFIGFADAFEVQLRSEDGTVTELGEFTNPTTAQTWFGVVSDGTAARYVDLIFANPNADAQVGSLGEIEIWGEPVELPEGTPTVDGTPVGSPVAEEPPVDEVATPGAEQPVVSEGTPVPEETAQPTLEPTIEIPETDASPESPATPSATDEPTEPPASPTVEPEPTSTATVEPTATEAATEEPTVEPTATETATEEPSATAEPTTTEEPTATSVPEEDQGTPA